MSKPVFEYADDIPLEDRELLVKKEPVFARAFEQKSVFWDRIPDSKNRSHYRAFSYTDRSQCLCQIVIPDIRSIDDEELVQKVINGKLDKRPVE
jgi:hypothetical protein